MTFNVSRLTNIPLSTKYSWKNTVLIRVSHYLYGAMMMLYFNWCASYICEFNSTSQIIDFRYIIRGYGPYTYNKHFHNNVTKRHKKHKTSHGVMHAAIMAMSCAQIY